MKKETKQLIISFIIIFLISCITHIGFLKGYYGVDAKTITNLGLREYAINYSFYDGRIFMGILCLIGSTFNISYNVFYISLLILAIATFSACVLVLRNIIEKIKPPKTKLEKLCLLFLCYLYIFNFMSMDCMQFIECFIMAIGILLYIISAKKIVLDNKKIVGYIYCLIGIFCYQGSINMFIITAVLFLLLKQQKINKDMIKNIIRIFSTVAICIFINFVYTKIIGSFITTVHESRMNLEIINNLQKVGNSIIGLVIYNLEQFPANLHLIFLIGMLIISYISDVKNKRFTFIPIIILIIVAYIAVLLPAPAYPGLLYNTNGRMMGAIGSVFSVVAIYLYAKADILQGKLKFIYTIVVVSYLLANMCNTYYLISTSKAGNNFDEEISKKIQNTIYDYEKDSNSNIENMAINIKLNKNKKYPRFKFYSSDILLGGYDSETYKLYTGEHLQNVYKNEEIIEKYFSDDEEKYICEGNTIYVQVVI